MGCPPLPPPPPVLHHHLQYLNTTTTLAITPEQKTDMDLFYIAPFYHLLLPHLSRVIVVDLDIQFRSDQVFKLPDLFKLLKSQFA